MNDEKQKKINKWIYDIRKMNSEATSLIGILKHFGNKFNYSVSEFKNVFFGELNSNEKVFIFGGVEKDSLCNGASILKIGKNWKIEPEIIDGSGFILGKDIKILNSIDEVCMIKFNLDNSTFIALNSIILDEKFNLIYEPILREGKKNI